MRIKNDCPEYLCGIERNSQDVIEYKNDIKQFADLINGTVNV
jgi:hypothetical protein